MRIYRSSARLHINPYMGEWLIREATTRRVDRVIKDHIAKGLDSQALRKHLSQVFDLAVRHDALPSNPVASVAKVRRAKGPKRIVEGAAQVAEIRALVQRWEAKDRPGPKATHDLYLFVMLLAVTGVRPGELLAVRWSEVNFLAERPYLEITGTIKQETGLGIYRQQVPKSTTSVRRVELPTSLVALLMDRKVNQSSPNPIDAVFPSRVGTWQAPTTCAVDGSPQPRTLSTSGSPSRPSARRSRRSSPTSTTFARPSTSWGTRAPPPPRRSTTPVRPTRRASPRPCRSSSRTPNPLAPDGIRTRPLGCAATEGASGSPGRTRAGSGAPPPPRTGPKGVLTVSNRVQTVYLRNWIELAKGP